jgi:hypothetical protein
VFLQVVGDFLPGVAEADPRPHGRGKVNDVVYECLDVASHGAASRVGMPTAVNEPATAE